jgi:glycosyltransferase involved in cell wall biosynthesis
MKTHGLLLNRIDNLKIGFVIYGDLNTISGGYLYDRMLVDYLRECGDTVRIISFPWKNYLAHLSYNFIKSYKHDLCNPEVDILIQDELNHPSLAWLNGKISGTLPCPVVSIVHHLRSSEKHPALLAPLYKHVEKKYLNSVDGFIFNSLTTKKEVENLLKKEVPGIVAYPSGARFTSLPDIDEIAKRIHQNPLRILFIGNIIPRKGLDTLIRALIPLASEDWELDIVGSMETDPPYSVRMLNLVIDNNLGQKIHFHGLVDDIELAGFYSRSHILAAPSVYEGFGIVCLEAMGFGVIPIASSAGGAGEIITHKKDGFLIPPHQPEMLENHIREILADRTKLSDMSRDSSEKFKQFSTWQQTGEKIRNYLLGMVDSKTA